MNTIITRTVDPRPHCVMPTFGYAVSGFAPAALEGAVVAQAIATSDQGTIVWSPPSC